MEMNILAKLEEKRLAREARLRVAAEMFDETGIVLVTRGSSETFLMVHPSTAESGGWQVSYFDRNGPVGHGTGPTRERAISESLDVHDFVSARPITEAEFMEVSATQEFREGSKRVTLVGLDNQIRFEFGYTLEVMRYCTSARDAPTIDEAIAILRDGLSTLRGR